MKTKHYSFINLYEDLKIEIMEYLGPKDNLSLYQLNKHFESYGHNKTVQRNIWRKMINRDFPVFL